MNFTNRRKKEKKKKKVTKKEKKNNYMNESWSDGGTFDVCPKRQKVEKRKRIKR